MEVLAVAINTGKGTTPNIAVGTRDIERTGRRVTPARSRIKSKHFVPYKTYIITQKGIDSLTGFFYITNGYVIPSEIVLRTNYTASGLLNLL